MKSMKNNGPKACWCGTFSIQFVVFCFLKIQYRQMSIYLFKIAFLCARRIFLFSENENCIHCLIIYIYTHVIHVSCQHFELSHLHCMPFPKMAVSREIEAARGKEREKNRTVSKCAKYIIDHLKSFGRFQMCATIFPMNYSKWSAKNTLESICKR